MSSLPDIFLPPQTWVNVTSVLGFAVGDDLVAQNTGYHRVRVAVSVSEPTSFATGALLMPKASATAKTAVTESVWAYSANGSLLQVDIL